MDRADITEIREIRLDGNKTKVSTDLGTNSLSSSDKMVAFGAERFCPLYKGKKLNVIMN
jgi:hypothetical protein